MPNYWESDRIKAAEQHSNDADIHLNNMINKYGDNGNPEVNHADELANAAHEAEYLTAENERHNH